MKMRTLTLALCIICGLAFMPRFTAANDEPCQSEDCETVAPYVLRIIKSGEGNPRATNRTEEGRAENRRADVTLTRKVPVEEIANEVRLTQLDSNGAVWISQDPTSLQRTLNASTSNRVSINNGQLEKPIVFEVSTNYDHFIQSLDLLIYDQLASDTAKPLVIKPLDASASWQQIEWNLDGIQKELKPGLQLHYALRASDADGRSDLTERQTLFFDDIETGATDEIAIPDILVNQELEKEVDELSGLVRESILVRGTMVRILGQDLKPGAKLLINQHPIIVDNDGRFGIEFIKPDGEHTFDVGLSSAQGTAPFKSLRVDVNSDYLFMVGLADVTVGENKVSGSLEPLSVDDQHYGGDIFVDGRLAFYLKGKVKGKYLVTAQMDTGTDDIENLFDNFHRKDPDSIFRRLDPDQYYPVYGDDSQLIDDTDSQGKLYVRVDWDRSRAIWGNFNTNFTGTEFSSFNRSLYGAQLRHISTEDTSLGDATHSLSVFGSRAQSLFRHNEFLGTGGSLYYLRDTDIVAGSEKVSVEVRQSDTERVVERITLVEGRDYTIDNFQGRILLQRPLLSVAAQSGPSIIRDEPLAGNQTFLIVDYEYVPPNLDLNDTSAGARGQKWVSDHVAIGGTVALESREGGDYSLLGADVVVKKSDLTFIKAELAETESAQTSGSFESSDGGLSFDTVTRSGDFLSGNAVGIEARASLTDFKPQSRQFDIGVWAKRRSAGFSTANTDVDVDTTDAGFELVTTPIDRIVVSARATQIERRDQNEETSLSAQLDFLATQRLTLSGELRDVRDKDLVANTTGASSVAGAKADFDVTDDLNVYAAHQQTLRNSGSETSNNGSTVGAGYTLNNRLGINGELSSSERGNSAILGVDVGVSDSYNLYSNYTYSLNQNESIRNTIVLGQRKTLSSQLKVYSEHQFSDEDDRNGFAHTVGLDQKLTQYTSVSLSLQRAVIDNNSPDEIERDTVSTGVVYQNDRTRASSKFEFRWDEGAETDIRQWVTTNRLDYRSSPDFRWQGLFNGSVSDDRKLDEDARFIEAGVGFAYRPVKNDRLNMLGRLTYLNDLPPLSQTDRSDQRSTIASVEGLYDLNRVWSTGAKFAYRKSEIRLQRNSGIWIDNDAALASARLRYKALLGVDATVAYHWLGSASTEGVRQGALFTIGRRVGNNLTFSVGYNFTSFDDDLTRSSFDAKGWFFNLIGTY